MEFWVDKFVEDTKYLIGKKIELVESRENLKVSIVKGEAFFSEQGKGQRELIAGASRMVEIIKELDALDRAILDVDTIIVSNLEMYLSNFVAKFKMPDRINDAGDLIKHEEVFAVPFKSGKDNVKEVSPEDIWFLKMIKEAYKATNITFMEK